MVISRVHCLQSKRYFVSCSLKGHVQSKGWLTCTYEFIWGACFNQTNFLDHQHQRFHQCHVNDLWTCGFNRRPSCDQQNILKLIFSHLFLTGVIEQAYAAPAKHECDIQNVIYDMTMFWIAKRKAWILTYLIRNTIFVSIMFAWKSHRSYIAISLIFKNKLVNCFLRYIFSWYNNCHESFNEFIR